MKRITTPQWTITLFIVVTILSVLAALRQATPRDPREERLLALVDTAEQDPLAMAELKRLLAAGVNPNATQPGPSSGERLNAALRNRNLGILWQVPPRAISAIEIACRATSLLGERDAFRSHVRPATVQVLVDAGADVNRKDFAGYTPLVYAFTDNQAAIARLMIEHGAKATPDSFGYLSAAPRYSRPTFDPQLVGLAIHAGANVDGLTQAGERPLHHALERGNVQLAAELLKHGARTYLPDRAGQTPRMLAQSILNRPSSSYRVWGTGSFDQSQIDAARLVIASARPPL